MKKNLYYLMASFLIFPILEISSQPPYPYPIINPDGSPGTDYIDPHPSPTPKKSETNFSHSDFIDAGNAAGESARDRADYASGKVGESNYNISKQSDVGSGANIMFSRNSVKVQLKIAELTQHSEIKAAYLNLEKMRKENIFWWINDNWVPVKTLKIAIKGAKANSIEEGYIAQREIEQTLPQDVRISKPTKITEKQNLERFSKLSITEKQKEITKLRQDNRNYEIQITNNYKKMDNYLNNKLQSKQNDEITVAAIKILKKEAQENKKQAEQNLEERRNHLEKEIEILKKECPQCVL